MNANNIVLWWSETSGGCNGCSRLSGPMCVMRIRNFETRLCPTCKKELEGQLKVLGSGVPRKRKPKVKSNSFGWNETIQKMNEGKS